MNASFYTSPVGEILTTALIVWSLFWKGLALWRAANSDQKYWFVAILIFNTFGILEIVYLSSFAKKKMTMQELVGILKNIKVSNLPKVGKKKSK